MEEYVLAIDQGTTSTRLILFDHEQKIVFAAQKEIETIYPRPGWVQEDANDIYLSVISLLGQLFQTTKIDPKAIRAIGISNQRETTVMWNRKTGIPVTSAIVWQSRQTADIVKRYKDRGLEEMIHQKTGLVLDPYFSATKIRWIYENVPGVSDDPDVIFGTVDTWLVWKLSGGVSHVTDVTNASRTLLFNIHTLKWDEELCEIFEIPMTILPKITDTACEVARIDSSIYGLDCPICAIVGDQQAALFGESCFKKGDIKNTYGTGGFILLNTDKDLIISDSGLLTTVAYKIGKEVKYALEGSIFVSGSLIQWLRDGLHLFTQAKDSETLAKSVPDNGGVVIVPAFVGLGAPYWDDDCRGAIFGLTRGINRAHIARAALEAMAFQVLDLIKVMEKETGMPIRELKVDGGASVNDFLLQFQSDVAKITIERPDIREATALGAARIAGLTVGFWKMEDFIDMPKTLYHPKADPKQMDVLYDNWLKALKSAVEFTK